MLLSGTARRPIKQQARTATENVVIVFHRYDPRNSMKLVIETVINLLTVRQNSRMKIKPTSRLNNQFKLSEGWDF